jgi:outer membrane protein W
MRTAIVRIAIAAALLSASARAEEAWVTTPSYRPHQTLFLVNWEIAGPIGSFDDYIDNTSLRGGSIEFRSFISDNVSLGLSFSWNRFEQTFDLVTAPINNGTASGPVFRYADMFGVRGLAHYYLTQGQLQPYLGFGIGGAWNYSYQQVSDVADSQENFNFIVDPEVGLLYWLAKGGTTAALNLAFRYTYTTATVGREEDAQTLSGIVGFAFGY